MQRSMVNELNSLAQSTVNTARQSHIFMQHDSDFPDLTFSHIKNLPGYKREDLSNKLDFIVVFQAIQIQRLGLQVQALRIRCKDSQRQKANLQNYQIQIRELTERCHILQMQKEGLEDQIERMKIFCQKIYRDYQQQKNRRGDEVGLKEKYLLQKNRCEQLQGEINRWRQRCNAMNLEQNQQISQIRKQFESRRKFSNDNDLVIAQQKIIDLTSQLSKTKEFYALCETQLNSFKQKEEKTNHLEDKLEQYQNQIVMLSQENYRLNEMLKWKGQELTRMKGTEKELQIKVESSKYIEDERCSLQQKYANIVHKNSQLEENHKLLNQKIEYFMKQNDAVKQKLVDRQKEFSSLRQISEQVKIAYKQLQQQYKEKIIQNQSISIQFQKNSLQLQQKVKDYELITIQYAQTNKKLQVSIVANENIVQKMLNFQRLKSHLQQLLNQLQQQHLQLQQTYNQTLEKNSALSQRLKETQLNLTNKQLQMNQIKNNFTTQIIQLKENKQYLQSQLRQYSVYKSRTHQLEQKYESISQKMKSQTQKFQIETSLKTILQNKLNATNQATMKQFSNYEQKMAEFRRQIQKLQTQLRSQKQEKEILKQKQINFQKERQQFKSLVWQKEQLQKDLGRYVIKIEEYSRKIMGLEQTVSLSKSIQQRYKSERINRHQLMEKNEDIAQELASLQKSLVVKQQRIQALQNQCNKNDVLKAQLKQSYAQIEIMRIKIQEISREINQKVIEISQIKQKITQIQKSRHQSHMIDDKLIQNLRQTKELVLKLDQSKRHNSQLQDQNVVLNLKINQVQKELLSSRQEKEELERKILIKDSDMKGFMKAYEQVTLKNSQLKILQKSYQQLDRANQNLREINQGLQQNNKRYKVYIQQIENINHENESRIQYEKQHNIRMCSQIEQMKMYIEKTDNLKNNQSKNSQLDKEFVTIKQICFQQNKMINDLRYKLTMMQQILKIIKQKYKKQQLIGQQLCAYSVSLTQKMLNLSEYAGMTQKYWLLMSQIRQQNLQLQSQRNFYDIQLCQSLKVIRQNNITTYKVSPYITNRSFQQKQSIKSIQNIKNQSLFSFKDTKIQQSIDKVMEQQQIQSQQIINNRNSEENGSIRSMEGTIINTLMTKQSRSRFEKNVFEQEEQQDRNSHGFGLTNRENENKVAHLRILSPQHHRNNLNYQTIRVSDPVQGTRLLIGGNINYVNQTDSIKRISSYSNFVPYFQNPSQQNRPPTSPTASESKLIIRAHSSTSGKNSQNAQKQYGKTIRIPLDPSRLARNY